MKFVKYLAVLVQAACLLLFPATARAGSYFQDFSGLSVGATNMGDGSQLFSTAPANTVSVFDELFKELQLIAYASNNTRSAFLLPSLDTNTTVYAFSAKWNSQVFGNFPTGADGFSFNFGPFAGLPLDSSAYSQESGFGTGLTFSVRTYTSGQPGFFINVNGGQLAAVTNYPQTVWGTFNTTRHLFEVDWHVHLGLTVRVDGQAIFSNIATTGFVPHPTNRFAWAARTGGETHEFRLDNIVVVSRGLLREVQPTTPYYTDSTNGSASEAFDRYSGTWWSKNAPTGYIGAAVPTRGVRVYALQASGNGNRSQDPRLFRFEGSNTGTNWTTCGTGGVYFVNDNETRCFLATNASQFAASRLNITANNSNLFSLTLGELRTFELMPITNDAPLLDWYIYGLADYTFSDVAWADYDNDGDLDFLVAGRVSGQSYQQTELWRNDGGGVFNNSGVGFVNVESPAMAWGDYNNDGLVDLFLGGGIFSDQAHLYRNDGGGNFTEIFTSIAAMGTGEARWLDYDNDGDLDLITVGQGNPGLWRNDGGDSFTEDTAVSVMNAYDSTVEVADFNLDGSLDYAAAGTGTPQLFLNDGDATFTGSTLVNQLMTAMPMTAGDADADGDADMYFAGQVYSPLYSITELRLNNGSGDLSTGGSSSNHVVVNGGDVAWGDYDHDGDLDCLLAGYDSGVNSARLLSNNGDGTMNGLTNVQMGGFQAGGYAWGDFDKDGRLDFIETGFSNFSGGAVGVAKLRRNFYGTANQRPSAPTGLTATTNSFVATFNWNAASDDATPSNGLTYALRVGTTPGGCQVVSPHADATTGVRRVAEFGNCWGRKSKTITLPSAGTFYWSVQAVDNSFAGSAFATEGTLVVTSGPPVIAVREPIAVSTTQATIRCTVATKGVTGTVWFLWGTNASYGSTVAATTLRTSTNFVLVGATVTGLVPGTTYYYKPVASNVAATVTNSGMAFVARVPGPRFDFTDPGDPLAAAPVANSPDGESPTQAVDNALSTKYLNFEGEGAGLDIKPSVTGTVKALTFASANDGSDRDPTNFTLAGSSDGTNFVQFASGAVPLFTDRHHIQSVALTNPASYTWYRILFPQIVDNVESLQIGELELLPYGDLVRSADASSLSLAPPGLSNVFSHTHLFDRFVNDNDDKFEATGFTTSDLVRVDVTPLSGTTILKGFELIYGTGGLSNPERRPGSVAVSGSNDGTNYTVLAVVVPDLATNEYAIHEYSVTNGANAFSKYRVTFDAPTNSDHVELGEVRLFGRSATAIEQWRQQHFGNTDDAGSSADTADGDGDLDRNLFEYATGSDPTSSNSASGLDLTRTNNFRLLFDRNTNASDATIYVEGANALSNGAPWQGLATNRNGSWGGATNVTEGGGNPATVIVTDTQPGTNRFLRLRVTHP